NVNGEHQAGDRSPATRKASGAGAGSAKRDSAMTGGGGKPRIGGRGDRRKARPSSNSAFPQDGVDGRRQLLGERLGVPLAVPDRAELPLDDRERLPGSGPVRARLGVIHRL